MRCPFSHNIEGGDLCLKEDCALWIEDINMCAIRDIAMELRWLQFHVQDIANRMEGKK